jgi:FtsP/CotA-like multicopper oxidase with cupredoxin domain
VNYKIQIPPFHQPGLYWYHAHLHTLAERQVMGGLSGGLIVEGILDPFPALKGIPERVMLLKDVQITAQGTLPDDIDPGGETNRTINGLTMPDLVIRHGELQFWRFANIGADMYYRLVLDGHVFYEFARDGNRRTELIEMKEIQLPPGSRSEVFVRGGKPGRYSLRTLDVNTGPDGDDYTAAPLATVYSQLSRGQGRALPRPEEFPPVADFRSVPVARTRTITFSEDPVNNIFFMDSGAGPNVFDPNRVDATIDVGTMEEWTVYNATAELHVFHIHQTDFQILEINGVPQPFRGHQDNVNVSFQPAGGPPGSVKFLIDFRNPDIVGKFVYHCHILEHEDGGMMSIAEVVDPATAGFGTLAPVAASPAPVNRKIILNTLEAFQAGSVCRTPPSPARGFGAPSEFSTAFRIERQPVVPGN